MKKMPETKRRVLCGHFLRDSVGPDPGGLSWKDRCPHKIGRKYQSDTVSFPTSIRRYTDSVAVFRSENS